MTVLLDTNIVMDALQERHPFEIDAQKILLHAQNSDFTCYITANAMADIYYLYSKTRDVKTAKQVLKFLLTTFEIISVTRDDCFNALLIPVEDFEDALVAVCAKKVGINYIISRDEKFLRENSPVTVIKPNEFLKKLEE